MAAYNRMYFFVYWVDGPFIRGEGEGGLIHACVCLCGGGEGGAYNQKFTVHQEWWG